MKTTLERMKQYWTFYKALFYKALLDISKFCSSTPAVTHDMIAIWVLGNRLHLQPVIKCLMIMWLPFAIFSTGFRRNSVGKPVGKVASFCLLLRRLSHLWRLKDFGSVPAEFLRQVALSANAKINGNQNSSSVWRVSIWPWGGKGPA